MEPIISTKETIFGKRKHFNFLKQPFLKQDIDLGFDFEIFGDPLDAHLSLSHPSGATVALDYQQNTETAKLLADRLHDQRTSPDSFNLKNGKILLYIYSLAESRDVQFLFVTRITTKLCKKTRRDWSFEWRIGERNCCFRNYCRDFKLSEDNPIEKINPGAKTLDKLCSYKKKHIDVTPVIWCYRLYAPFEEKIQSSDKIKIGFKVKYDGIISGMPLISQFGYGSLFKNDLKQERNHQNPFDPGIIYINCRELYQNLSEKSQFLAFIRDCLNTVWLTMRLSDEVYKKLGDKESFSYKLIGCLFYF